MVLRYYLPIAACLLSIISVKCLAQSVAYLPNAKKVAFQFSTINDLKKGLNVSQVEMYNTKQGMVLFKKFTKIPVAILLENKVKPESIPAMIASYGPVYKKYLFSSSYYYDLRSMMNDSTLTSDFIRQTFGKPSNTVVEESDSTLHFPDYNCTIGYTEGELTRVNVYNPNAIFKQGLSINKYEVTGEDYTIGFDVSIHNYDNRTIKYAYFSVTATNDVDDVVGKKTVSAVGPIEKGENGSYEFKDIIYSRSASSLSIDSIRILYMNGTQRVIPKSEINLIKFHDWEEELNRVK